MKGGVGQKMSVFVHPQGIKTVGGGGGQKMAKFPPRSCLMHPRLLAVLDIQAMINLKPYRISLYGVVVFATEFAFSLKSILAYCG